MAASQHRSSIPGGLEQNKSYRHDVPGELSDEEDSDGYTSSVYEESIDDLSDNEDAMSSHTPSKTDAAPELPNRSAMRVNRLLTGLSHKLDTEQRPVIAQAPPHDLYLSSEEDASSSAEDGSECYFDSDDEMSSVSSEQSGVPDTARAVTVIFSGKPSMILLPKRQTEPKTVAAGQNRNSRASFAQRMSIVSVASSVVSIASPTRSRNSLMLDFRDKPRPLFLESDPFPSSPDDIPRHESMLRKTLKLVKQRSKSRLNHAAAMSRDSLLLEQNRPLSRGDMSAFVAEQNDLPKSLRKSYTTSLTMPGPGAMEAPAPAPSNRRRVLPSLSRTRSIKA
ncbi:hypothetical protein S7711_06441 [Stachybotrys chartarum IBT 7711]|uniref:Uncharacterized protein n=1 Tax=Stachybotrys chartarum (strain CBS 109288 / IBT 7711) TaxID=1280523 RepID=A0A084AX57_STACB|nr:hypothetical protein S7711_06441 [Stachybotrys chartarum IBT 7711]